MAPHARAAERTDIDRPETARLLISDADRETIRMRLLADRELYGRAYEHGADDPHAQQARRALEQVEAALRRLDTPDYGYCARCGVRIAIARLLELPHTELCLPCAGGVGG